MIDYLRVQFRVWKKHKMDLPDDLEQCTKVAEIIKVHAPNSTHPEEIDRAIKHAITNARDFFIHDNQRKYCDTKSWFKSRAYHSSTGKSTDCMVVPNPNTDERSEVGLILKPEVNFFTHHIVIRKERPKAKPRPNRLMVEVVVSVSPSWIALKASRRECK